MFMCYFYFSIQINVEEILVGVLDFLTDYKVPLDGFDIVAGVYFQIFLHLDILYMSDAGALR